MTTKRKRRGRKAQVAGIQATTYDANSLTSARPSFAPLTDQEMSRIHASALDVLETIGIGMMNETPPSMSRVLELGPTLSDSGRILFPRALVEDMLTKVNRNWMLHGLDSRFDLEITPRTTLFGTAGAAPNMRDFHQGHYRASTALDLYEATRLCDTLDRIRWCHRPLVVTDAENDLDLDINTVYGVLSGTGKPIGASISTHENFEPVVEMLDMVLGGEGRHKERPMLHITQGLGVPPLRFAGERVRNAEAAIRHGIPMITAAAAQAGATGPAALAGTLVQSCADILGALTYINLLAPGHPCLFGGWPFVADLRTGSMSGGSAEQALLTAGMAQMGRFYDIPSSLPAGMTDSKLPDAQAGFEKGMASVLAALAGGNMMHESAGMQASLMGVTLEGLVIDNTILGCAERVMRGIEVTDDTLSNEVIHDVIFGDGHYLGHDQTYQLMKREYHYPPLSDRTSIADWEETGAKPIDETARDYVQATLSSHFPTYIPEAVDARIRKRFNILVPRDEMRAQTSRWNRSVGAAA